MIKIVIDCPCTTWADLSARQANFQDEYEYMRILLVMYQLD